MAIFVVDLLSLLYVSKLGDPNLTAAVGFAAIVQFFAIAINIGLMIAAGALVGKRGRRRRPARRARRLATSAPLLGIVASALLVALPAAAARTRCCALIGARARRCGWPSASSGSPCPRTC